jgi:class 3 adenylate cyclase/pimeloyl-ACP methyl ester carboxylesterase
MSGLASFARLILFDRRGSGLSDGSGAIATLDEQLDDVRAVLAATGAERPALLAIMEGCAIATLFAATYPSLVRALVLYAPMARAVRAPGYEWASTAERWTERTRAIVARWGQPQVFAWFAPTVACDQGLQRWMARYQRLSMGPSTAAAHREVIGETDVRRVLPSVQCPTLILHRPASRMINERHARYVAEHVPGARYVRLPGEDAWLFAGPCEIAMGEIQEFLTGTRHPVPADRVLATILFTDIVGSTDLAARHGDASWQALLERHDRVVREHVLRQRGRVVKSTGDGVLAIFDGPSRAIFSAIAIRDSVRDLGLDIRAGLHTGECELRGDDIGGLSVHIGARVSALADPGQVIISGTVRDLVVGSPIALADRGEHELRGVPGLWRIYAVRA